MLIVGGPTISDDYPAVFGVFAGPGTQCAVLNLAAPIDQSVQVSSIVVPNPWQLASDEVHCGMADATGVPDCLRYTFPAGDEGACELAVRLPASAGGRDWYGTELTLTYETHCTSLVGFMCSKLAGTARPTAVKPVIALGHRTLALKACLQTVPDGSSQSSDGGELYLTTDEQCRLPIVTASPSE